MSKKSKLKRSELDLNGDGKLDAKDKSIAASVLATDLDKVEAEVPQEAPAEEKEEDVKEEKEAPEGSRVAAIDVNLIYRKGDLVPRSVVAKWEECGLDLSLLLEN